MGETSLFCVCICVCWGAGCGGGVTSEPIVVSQHQSVLLFKDEDEASYI